MEWTRADAIDQAEGNSEEYGRLKDKAFGAGALTFAAFVLLAIAIITLSDIHFSLGTNADGEDTLARNLMRESAMEAK